MKKVYTGIVVVLFISVFVVSFLIGRATALRKSDGEKKEMYTGTVPIPKDDESVKTASPAEKVPDTSNDTEENSVPDVSIPDRMIFPCGEVIQKDYSQPAVFSETMGDWRAHTGIDYSAEEGSEVLSVWNGTVMKVYEDKLWGHCVEIDHGNNLKSVYRNLSENIQVEFGDTVSEGQAIGYVGRSAAIESIEKPHLHFEMWQDNLTINPNAYVY